MVADAEDKLVVEHLYKVFGPEPERALEALGAGKTKDEILEETGLTVGVQDASFTVKSGEIFVVMGLSGSGKSTLVRMLNRLIEPTSGDIYIDGENVVNLSARQLREMRLRRMAMVFQHFALFPHMTVAENVAYGLKIRGVDASARRERALRALDQVGLAAWAESAPNALSGGMQQRVGLARGLAVDPEILLMDEPFSALDPLIRRDMQEELLKLQEQVRKTIVFISHDLNEALLLGDRIAIMKEGRFVQVGTPQEIVSDPADDYVAAFTQDIDRARVFTVSHLAEPAHALTLGDDDVDSALARMNELGRSGLYVMSDGEIAGVVAYRDVAEADRGRDLGALLHEEFPSARPDKLLHEIYDACSSGLPIAVVGDDGELAGVVDPLQVFAELAPREREGGRVSTEEAAPARAERAAS